MSGIASITRSSLNPTTAVTNTSAPYAVRSASTALRMMLSPERSTVSGLGCGRPRRVPSPAARITTCLATTNSLVDVDVGRFRRAYRWCRAWVGATADEQVRGGVQASVAQRVRWQGGGWSRGGATATDDNDVQRA